MKFLFCSTLPPNTPTTAKPARDKGVRSMGARSATHPCGAADASGNPVVSDYAAACDFAVYFRLFSRFSSFRCAKEGTTTNGPEPCSGASHEAKAGKTPGLLPDEGRVCGPRDFACARDRHPKGTRRPLRLGAEAWSPARRDAPNWA